MNTWTGDVLQISIFGESHGVCVGATLDGLSAGIEFDFERINSELLRRKPHGSQYTTARQENDEYEILSGIYEGRTDGAPLTVIFKNIDAHHDDYKRNNTVPRPSHADFAAQKKHDGACDLRGGGHYSARLTAPLVFFGAMLRQLLEKHGIIVGSHILRIGSAADTPFDLVNVNAELLRSIDPFFPVISESAKAEMESELAKVKNVGDSVGACIECAIVGVGTGIGEPFFGSVESRIASLCFSIPSVKAVEFGMGAKLAEMYASEANDAFCPHMEKNTMYDFGKTAYTNNAGGVIGGMTYSMPIVFRAVMKPIPSVSLEQQSINLQTGEVQFIRTHGRHDVCAGLRGAVIVEAIACICMYDLLLRQILHEEGRVK